MEQDLTEQPIGGERRLVSGRICFRARGRIRGVQWACHCRTGCWLEGAGLGPPCKGSWVDLPEFNAEDSPRAVKGLSWLCSWRDPSCFHPGWDSGQPAWKQHRNKGSFLLLGVTQRVDRAGRDGNAVNQTRLVSLTDRLLTSLQRIRKP